MGVLNKFSLNLHRIPSLMKLFDYKEGEIHTKASVVPDSGKEMTNLRGTLEADRHLTVLDRTEPAFRQLKIGSAGVEESEESISSMALN